MKLLIIVLLIIATCAAFVVYKSVSAPERNILDIGTFVVITLTLLALIVYAYDTHSMARIDREHWKRASVLNTTYTMEGIGDVGGQGRTLFRIHNPSTLLVRAKVRCNFQVYGQSVEYHPDFNGTATWYVFPQQTSQGWFEIEPLLGRKGQTPAQMQSQRTASNRTEQLTMDLELEFRDELGNSRKLPARRHFFDFKEWQWIPLLTMKDDWV